MYTPFYRELLDETLRRERANFEAEWGGAVGDKPASESRAKHKKHTKGTPVDPIKPSNDLG